MKINLSGLTLGYDVEGAGPALVLLHGFPLHRAMWTPQVAALRDRFAVIVPDLRGFGESDAPGDSDGMTMDAYADDVVRLLDALGHDRVILGGFSMGGYVLFRVLARAADRIRALIIADSRAGADSPEARQRRHAAIARLRAEGSEGFLHEFVGGLVGPTTKARRPDVLAAVRRIVGTPPVGALVGGLAAMAARPDSRPLLATVQAPTLILVGEEDALTPPEAADEIAAGLRGATVARIPSAGHLSNLEAPDAFNQALRGFLAGL